MTTRKTTGTASRPAPGRRRAVPRSATSPGGVRSRGGRRPPPGPEAGPLVEAAPGSGRCTTEPPPSPATWSMRRSRTRPPRPWPRTSGRWPCPGCASRRRRRDPREVLRAGPRPRPGRGGRRRRRAPAQGGHVGGPGVVLARVDAVTDGPAGRRTSWRRGQVVQAGTASHQPGVHGRGAYRRRRRWGPRSGGSGRRNVTCSSGDPALDQRGEGTVMEIGYTEEQQALRQELREYYANLLTPEVEEELANSHGIGPAAAADHQADGQRRVAGDRLAQGVGRSGPVGHRAVHLLRRVHAQRRARAHAHHQHRRAHHHELGSEEQKEFFLPKILAGEIHFCIGYTEPNAGTDLAALQTKAVSTGRARHQRGQDLHQPGRRCRLLLAGRPNQSRCLQTQGDLHGDRPHGHPRGAGRPHAAARRSQHQLHVLGGRPGPGDEHRGRGSTTAGRSSPTSSTTNG